MWKHNKRKPLGYIGNNRTFYIYSSNDYVKKKSEKVQISDLMKQIKNLEKQQTKSKPIRQQDIVKIRAKIDTI